MNFLEQVLIDDPNSAGGVSYSGETLENFLLEVGLPLDSDITEINNALTECGVLPLSAMQL